MPEENELTDVDKLQAVMKELNAEDNVHIGGERRKYSLTEGDVMLIYQIAKIAGGHTCPFEDDESETLQTVAKNINRTQKIASGIIIVSLVTAGLSGIWFALKHIIVEFVHNGGVIK